MPFPKPREELHMAKATRKAAARRKAPRAKATKRATKRVAPIPEYLHAVTAHLAFKDSAAAIAFYAKAFGAKELSRMPTPDGKTMHAEIKIGDSVLFLADESPMSPIVAPSGDRSSTTSFALYVKDCDAAYARALAAGAKAGAPIMDMFWGDRMGTVVDPFGYSWMIATQKAKLTPKQVKAAFADFLRKQEPVALPHEPGAEEYGPGDA
jgi:uncharacterized glyoxalase superfamily protein PhnB